MVHLHSGLEPRGQQQYQAVLRAHSDLFKVARVICIFCMVYVHTYLFDDEAYFQDLFSNGLRVLLVDLLGRSSVPLLSVISGVLMVGYFSQRPYAQAVRRRALTLLPPMICWIALYTLLALGVNPSYRPAIVELVPVFQAGQFLHLDFLRDVFVLAAMTPGLLWLVRRGGWLGVMLIAAAGAGEWLYPLVLRGQILLFYGLGLLFGCYRLGWLALAKLELGTYLAGGLLAAAVLAEQLYGIGPLVHLPNIWVDLGLVRPIGCLLFYFIASRLIAWPAWLNLVRRHLEPAVFILFLSHAFSVRLFSGALAALPGLEHPLVYHTLWFALPLLCYAVALVLWHTLRFTPSWLQILVAGKARAGGIKVRSELPVADCGADEPQVQRR